VVTRGAIVRRDGPQYREKVGDRMLPSQHAAMAAIETWRTAARGGHVDAGPACGTLRSRDHAWQNRHGPRCQQDATPAWLERPPELRLPRPYCMVTCPRPAELRQVARSHLPQIDRLRLRAAAAA